MSLTSCTGDVFQSDIGASFLGGSAQASSFCLEVGLNGIMVEVGGGLYPDEVSWSITLPSGIVETGVSGSQVMGVCPPPSPQPSVTSMPTACEVYTFDLVDKYGDG